MDDHKRSVEELRPALGARHNAGATAVSARNLLITVLGEFVLPAGGSVWTQTITEALALVGVQDKAARQAVDRLHQRGWLERERVGRRSRLTLTAYATELLSLGAERIYGFGQGPERWNEEWVLLLVTVPEAKRNLRYRLSVGLTWAGFGSLGHGTWISPRPDAEAEAIRLLDEMAVGGAATFVGRLGRLGSPDGLANRAWDLEQVANEYRGFLEAERNRAPDDNSESVARLTALVNRWRRFPFIDPALPREALPAGWPGPAASSRFAGLRADLRPSAEQWWSETEAKFAPQPIG